MTHSAWQWCLKPFWFWWVFCSWHPHATKFQACTGRTMQNLKQLPQFCDLGGLSGAGRENKSVWFYDCWDRSAPVGTACFWIWRVTGKFSQPGKLQKEGKKSQKITQAGSGSRRVNKIWFLHVWVFFFCDLLHPTAVTPGTVPASTLAFLSLCFIFMAMLIVYPIYRWIHKSLF